MDYKTFKWEMEREGIHDDHVILQLYQQQYGNQEGSGSYSFDEQGIHNPDNIETLWRRKQEELDQRLKEYNALVEYEKMTKNNFKKYIKEKTYGHPMKAIKYLFTGKI